MYQIQNKHGISYAGAYLKYRFHEDGFMSGLLAACSVEDEGLYKRIHEQFSSSADCKPNKVINMKNVTVRPPFDIEHADHHLFFRQSPANMILAGAFGVIEARGLRTLVGLLGGVVLGLCNLLLLLCP
jgi:hypothetical protein